MPLAPDQLDELHNQLLTRQRALLDVAVANAEASATVELDQTRVGRLSRMDALQGQAMSQAAGRRREIELQRIASALRRMQEGDYGDCLRCDNPIALPRLRIDPAATLCIDCASKAES